MVKRKSRAGLPITPSKGGRTERKLAALTTGEKEALDLVIQREDGSFGDFVLARLLESKNLTEAEKQRFLIEPQSSGYQAT